MNLTIPSFQFTIDLPGFDPVTAGFEGFSAGLDTSGAKARVVENRMTDRVIEVNQSRVNRDINSGNDHPSYPTVGNRALEK